MADPIPYWRMFPGQFAHDTMHLPAVRLGYHIRLLMLAWRRAHCSIPHDENWIALRLGIDADEYSRNVEPMIGDLWEIEGDDLVCDALRAERLDVIARSEKARKAAAARYGGN